MYSPSQSSSLPFYPNSFMFSPRICVIGMNVWQCRHTDICGYVRKVLNTCQPLIEKVLSYKSLLLSLSTTALHLFIIFIIALHFFFLLYFQNCYIFDIFSTMFCLIFIVFYFASYSHSLSSCLSLLFYSNENTFFQEDL